MVGEPSLLQSVEDLRKVEGGCPPAREARRGGVVARRVIEAHERRPYEV
jgi:hypothetical protein